MPPGGDRPSARRKKSTAQKSDPHYKGPRGGRRKPFDLGVRKPRGPGRRKQKQGSKSTTMLLTMDQT